MNFLSIFLGLLVAFSWLLVASTYKNDDPNTTKSDSTILLACILTLLMAIIQNS
ncbi:hypothetical protein JWK66_02275 [Staphylococcus simulans]|uniref:hypothetical protein n=1 Tax=Staphylococcus simulans TaxID=1286 RepID=UPI001A8C61D6|nr:hypothetical protein [Staphylococcus simulans]MBO0386169.1 hypothetical protein [Staphylococcus simulans]